MLIDITDVAYLGGHRLRLTFDDGVEGELDFAEFLSFQGVFAALKDPSAFAQVLVNPDWGTICWPNGSDYSAETLYAKITDRPKILKHQRVRYAEA